MKITRRGAMAAGAAVLAAGAGVFSLRRFMGPHYAPTPYDDLLNQIVDRVPAATLGKAVVTAMPHLDVPLLAAELRRPGFALSARARTDAAARRVREVEGWIVPESVALYAALAAHFG